MQMVRTCEQCGRRFRGTRRARFCSGACRSKHHRRKSESTPQKNDRYCRHCKRLFFPQSDNQIFCSPACRREHKRRHRIDTKLVNGKPVSRKRRTGTHIAYNQSDKG